MMKNRRTATALAVFALVVSACGSSEFVDGPGPGVADLAPGGDAASPGTPALAYQFDAVDVLTYATDMSATMEMAYQGVGDPGLGGLGIGEPITTDMDLGMQMTLAIGPDRGDGTYEIAQTLDDFEFRRLSVDGGIGGAFELTEADLIAAAGGEAAIPMDTEIVYVVDEAGVIQSLEVGGMEISSTLFGGQPGLGGLGTTPLLGAPLPEGDVSVGDSWVTTSQVDIVPGRAVETTFTSTLVEIQSGTGSAVYVIETIGETPEVALTMADVLGGSEMSPEEEMVLGLLGGLDMSYTLAPATTVSTVWFDQARGITVAQDVTSAVSMVMTMAGLEGFGDAPLEPLVMVMDMTMTMSLALVS